MKILAFILLLILFGLWTYLVKSGKTKKIDDKIYKSFVIKDIFTSFYRLVTICGSAPFFIAICTLLFIIFYNKYVFLIIFFMIIEWSSNEILKRIFRRERPNIRRLIKEKGYSYPSGHTMSSTCFYGLTIFLISISSMLISIKIILILALVLLILLVGISRIYLGVHYFSDIVGGVLISLSMIFIYVYFMSDVLSII